MHPPEHVKTVGIMRAQATSSQNVLCKLTVLTTIKHPIFNRLEREKNP